MDTFLSCLHKATVRISVVLGMAIAGRLPMWQTHCNNMATDSEIGRACNKATQEDKDILATEYFQLRTLPWPVAYQMKMSPVH